ncbi:MAG: signal peptide peptidase SppA [Acidobacteria bacterium]|nr:MAG: signal peptide peptidase SppA [Acidobacteriota bacterium]
MAKFLIGVLTGIILVGLFLFIAIFALARMREKPPVIADGSTLMLDLEGEIPERAPVEFPIPFLQRHTPPTVADVWGTLRKATADNRIRAIIFEPRDLSIGWGKLEEIRADLENFRKSGKPIYAYLKTPSAREYYLATAASRVYMESEDELNLKGMRFELMYFKKTLDKLGAHVEIEHAGKYKDFGDMFTRTNMSPETKEVLNSIIDDLYGNLVKRIAEARKRGADEIRATIDQGPFLSPQAREKGLIDGLLYEDQVFDEVKRKLNSGDLKRVSFRDYVKVPAPASGLDGKQQIALVTGEGGISRGDNGSDFSSDSGIGSEEFVKLLRRVGADGDIKGVIVRVDSPGGEVFASDAIWREMNLLSKKKAMVISMSDTAASGGYYIAMTGDPVVAYPGTFTGSIGVVFGKANLHGLYDKLGVNKELLSRGRFADIDSDYQPLSPAGREKLRSAMDDNYRSFVTKVAEARRRKFDQIEPLAQGRVWLGSQAKANGLIDELGGLDRALDLVKVKAKIPKSERVTLVTYPPKRSVFDILFGQSAESAMESRLGGLLKGWQLRLWAKGGMMRLMPFTIDVR